jgi:thioredoxin-related protein
MKNFVNFRIFSAISLVTFFLFNKALAQVEFEEVLLWQNTLNQASEEDKLVFVDAYTDWCGWCKVMDKKTFSKEEVGTYMNENMVSVKIEMEKTDIGKKISMKYGINSFPTFLIFSSSGVLIYKLTGFQEADKFLENLRKAAIPENHLVQPGYSAGLEEEYPEFFKQAFAENGKRIFPDSLEVEGYLNQESDYTDEVVWQVIKRFSHMIGFEQSNRIRMHKEEIISAYGYDEYEGFVSNMASSQLRLAIKMKDEGLFMESIELLKQNMREPENMIPYFSLTYYKGMENWTEVVIQIDELRSSKPDLSVSFLNGYAWDIYEKCPDQQVIEKAIGWLKPDMMEDTDWQYLDTYAALLYKNGQYDLAEEWAIKAIKNGTEAEANVSDTEALLTKIKAERKVQKATE